MDHRRGRCEQNRLDLFEFTEHCRARRDSGYDWDRDGYLPAFRLLPVVFLCLSWIAIDVRLDARSETLVDFAEVGTFLLAGLGVFLIQAFFYAPRYGWPQPDNGSFWDQLRSSLKLCALLIGIGVIAGAGIFIDLVFEMPASFTLLVVSALLVFWWWLVGTRGGLFYAESDYRFRELGLPLRNKIWELLCRHYHLVLASIVALTSLTPVTGLVDAGFFADEITLFSTFGLLVTVCMFFDERRLRRHDAQ